MKKILLSASLIALIAAPIAKADPFKGTYAGAQLGWGQQKVKAKFSAQFNGTSASLKAQGKEDFAPFGFHVGMSSVTSGNVYLAGEAGMDFWTKSASKTYAPYIDGKLGYKIHDRVVAYGSVGVALGMFRAKTKAGHHKDENEFGARFGGGLLFAATDKIAVGAQYTYTRYSEIEYRATAGGNSVKLKYRPESHAIMARASYTF